MSIILTSRIILMIIFFFRNLSDQGKTIVCTIHQPSSQVFAMFDRILLMAEGRVAFLGNTNDAVDFFQNINRPCPYNFNPADHYIHVLAVRPGNEAQCREEINSICDSFTVTDAGQTVRFCQLYLTEGGTYPQLPTQPKKFVHISNSYSSLIWAP